MNNTHICTTGPLPLYLLCSLRGCCPQKPFIPHRMRDSLPAGSSISRDLGHSTHPPLKPTQAPTLTSCSMVHHAVYKIKPNNKSTSCLSTSTKSLIRIISVFLPFLPTIFVDVSNVFTWINSVHGANTQKKKFLIWNDNFHTRLYHSPWDLWHPKFSPDIFSEKACCCTWH